MSNPDWYNQHRDRKASYENELDDIFAHITRRVVIIVVMMVLFVFASGFVTGQGFAATCRAEHSVGYCKVHEQRVAILALRGHIEWQRTRVDCNDHRPFTRLRSWRLAPLERANRWHRAELKRLKAKPTWYNDLYASTQCAFGPAWYDATLVCEGESHCRSGPPGGCLTAQNGQYLGCWQMGSTARAVHGHGYTFGAQAYAAASLYRSAGGWGPWECKPSGCGW